jgi:putative methyltransferase (TIGR04325 family)
MAVRALTETPAVKSAWSILYERQFTHWPGAFRGVYASFEEAARSAPSQKLGYDNDESAKLYEDRMNRVFPSDYPVLFWLRPALSRAKTVFDFGGHVGIAWYAYARYVTFPEDLRWIVCDVPAVVRAGATLAEQRGERHLRFTTDFAEGSGADIFLASGSLQYVETPLHVSIAKLAEKPRSILLNKTPLHERGPFVTLQNTGPAYHPYWVFHRRDFIESIVSLGYKLVDEWQNAELSCRIPIHEDKSVPVYSGLYFERTSS